MTAFIRFEGATKIYGRKIDEATRMMADGATRAKVIAATAATPALFGVTLEASKGQTTVILGLSGSGKSTLLRLLNRVVDPTSGTVEIDGTAIASLGRKQLRDLRRKHVAMVFQQFGLLQHRSVRDNIAFGLEVQSINKSQRDDIADQWVEAVGLTGYGDAFPSSLSGGMRQRVGLARALATNADTLLMDEPFSALDPLTRNEMQDLLTRLQRDMHKTVVFVTHDVTEAFRLGDRLAILDDGRLAQAGAPMDLIQNPSTNYVRRFLANLDVLKGVSVRHVMNTAMPVSQVRSIDRDAPIGEALSAFGADTQSIAVTCGDGHPVGTISLTHIQQLLRSVSQ